MRVAQCMLTVCISPVHATGAPLLETSWGIGLGERTRQILGTA